MLTIAQAQELASSLLIRAGVPPEHAIRTADAIVLADVWGIGSHGLMRLPYYLERLRMGGYNPRADLVTVTDTGPLVTYDGQGGLGHWQAWQAAETASLRARQYGVAAVAVGNSGHCGALGIYTLPGLEAGLVPLVFSHGPAVMPPWGGQRPVLSTSPLAAGIPLKGGSSIIDLATTAVARGKIAEKAKKGDALPDGWAFDSQGKPTNDPEAALTGMLAPFGGAKGYVLALLVETLTGGLVGPSLSDGIPDMFNPGENAAPQRIAHLVLTLDPARLDVQGSTSRRRLDDLADVVTAAGGRLPGTRKRPLSTFDPTTPLTVPDATITDLEDWARRLQKSSAIQH